MTYVQKCNIHDVEKGMNIEEASFYSFSWMKFPMR